MPFLPEPLPAGQVDEVVSAGVPGDVFEPRRTTHGFQYVRVEGHPGDLTADDVRGVVVHTDLRRTGWFACSDERLNRLHEAAVWSFRDNACDVPTDCPHRERAGWTGDWQLFVPTAAFLYDVAGFSTQVAARRRRRPVARRHGREHQPDARAPRAGDSPIAFLNGSAGWGDAAVIVPWELYRAYGDAAGARRAVADDGPLAGPRRADGPRPAAPGPGRRAGRSRRRTSSTCGTPASTGASGSCRARTSSDFAAFVAADKGDVATAYFARQRRPDGRGSPALLGRDDDADRYAELAGAGRATPGRPSTCDADGRLDPGHPGQPRAGAGLRPGARRAARRPWPSGWSS